MDQRVSSAGHQHRRLEPACSAAARAIDQHSDTIGHHARSTLAPPFVWSVITECVPPIGVTRRGGIRREQAKAAAAERLCSPVVLLPLASSARRIPTSAVHADEQAAQTTRSDDSGAEPPRRWRCSRRRSSNRCTSQRDHHRLRLSLLQPWLLRRWQQSPLCHRPLPLPLPQPPPPLLLPHLTRSLW